MDGLGLNQYKKVQVWLETTVRIGCVIIIPMPCPPALLLLSAPTAPAEAPAMVEGAIVFDSLAVVMSGSVVMTILMSPGKGWTD